MSITNYSVRYPFIITYDKLDEVYEARPFFVFDDAEDYYGTCSEDLDEVLKMAGDLLVYLLDKLSDSDKAIWRDMMDPTRPNLYLIAPREYCVFCQEFDECSPDCESDDLIYEIVDVDDD